MFARLHVLSTTPEQSQRGLELVRDQLLPWLRDSTGYRGLIRFTDETQEKTLVISLWADEESLQASAEAGDRLSKLTAANVGATRVAVEEYEATLFDL